MRKRHTHHQSGNVLFIILIAVALFAALSYAVTQSGRSGGGDVSAEKSELVTSQILQYASSIESSIMRLKVSNRCDDTQISFEHSPFDDSDTSYVNPNSPSDFSCHVFHPDGGGVSVNFPPENINDGSGYFFTGTTCVGYIGSGNTAMNGGQCWSDGTNEDTELLLIIPNVTEEFCYRFNATLDPTIPSNETDITVINGSIKLSSPFKGTYGINPTQSYHMFGNHVSGHSTMCWKAQADNPGFHIYHVLIVR